MSKHFSLIAHLKGLVESEVEIEVVSVNFGDEKAVLENYLIELEVLDQLRQLSEIINAESYATKFNLFQVLEKVEILFDDLVEVKRIINTQLQDKLVFQG